MNAAVSQPVGGGVPDAPRFTHQPNLHTHVFTENTLSPQNGVKVKICGLTREQDIEAVNNALPDLIGFVFAQSRRRVDPDKAKALKALLDNRIRAVGVFVNAPVEEVAQLCKNGVITTAQLHGDEDEAYIRKLKTLTDAPIIKAVRVQSAQDILTAQAFPCDYLLLDTYTPNTYGGSGQGFDYTLIPAIEKPFFLAGGLKLQTLPAALAMHPYGVDISSGAETDGVKDSRKISDLVAMVRGRA